MQEPKELQYNLERRQAPEKGYVIDRESEIFDYWKISDRIHIISGAYKKQTQLYRKLIKWKLK